MKKRNWTLANKIAAAAVIVSAMSAGVGILAVFHSSASGITGFQFTGNANQIFLADNNVSVQPPAPPATGSVPIGHDNNGQAAPSSQGYIIHGIKCSDIARDCIYTTSG
jgi:hypothetical protein